MHARVTICDFVPASSNQPIEPRVGIYIIQGVLIYTDSGIRRRLDNDRANNVKRERQYRVLVKKSTERLHAFGSRFFRGKTLGLASSQSFLPPWSSIRSHRLLKCLTKFWWRSTSGVFLRSSLSSINLRSLFLS